MKLKKLSLRNFRSFLEADINFPENGLVLISGKNTDTGDSSGSGKSSIMLGIAYALGTLPAGFPATELTSWHATGDMQVTLEFEVQGHFVVLNRGKKNSLSFDGRTITGAKPIEEALLKLFGVSGETLAALTYRAQGELGMFVSRTPAEKTEFLVPLLGLDKVEAVVEKAQKDGQQLQNEVQSLQAVVNNLASHEATISAGKPEEIKDLIAPKQKVTHLEEELATLTAQRQDLMEDVAEMEADLEAATQQEKEKLGVEIQALRDRQAVLAHEDRVKEEGVLFQRASLQEKIDKSNKALELIRSSVERKARYLEQIKHLESSLCHTCGQQWTDAKKKKEELLEEIGRSLDPKIAMEEAVSMAKISLESEIKALRFVPNPEVAEVGSRIAAIHARREVLRADSSDPEYNRLKKALLDKYNAQTKARTELDMAVFAYDMDVKWNKRVKEAEETRLKSVEKIKEQRAAIAAELIAKQKLADAELDFADAMGRNGFLGAIFEEVLGEIAVEANKALSQIANVRHVSVGFRTESTTKSGTTKRAIASFVVIDGREVPFVSGLSGGMKTSVEQAVDLALINVIQRRTGRFPGWICLDEVFNGQGRVSKESTLDILKNFAQDKLVLVIDHGTEFQESFVKTIAVENNNGISRIKE